MPDGRQQRFCVLADAAAEDDDFGVGEADNGRQPKPDVLGGAFDHAAGDLVAPAGRVEYLLGGQVIGR